MLICLAMIESTCLASYSRRKITEALRDSFSLSPLDFTLSKASHMDKEYVKPVTRNYSDSSISETRRIRGRILAAESRLLQSSNVGMVTYKLDSRFYNATLLDTSLKFSTPEFETLSPNLSDSDFSGSIELKTSYSGAVFEIPAGISEISASFLGGNCWLPILSVYSSRIPQITVSNSAANSIMSIRIEMDGSLINSKGANFGNFNATNTAYSTRAINQTVTIESANAQKAHYGVIFCPLMIYPGQPFKAKISIGGSQTKTVTISSFYNDKNELSVSSIESMVRWNGETRLLIKGNVEDLLFTFQPNEGIFDIYLISNDGTQQSKSIGTTQKNQPFDFAIQDQSNFSIVVKNKDPLNSYPFAITIVDKSKETSGSSSTGIIIGSIIAGLVVILAIVGLIFCFRIRKRKEVLRQNRIDKKLTFEEIYPELPRPLARAGSDRDPSTQINSNAQNAKFKDDPFANYLDYQGQPIIHPDIEVYKVDHDKFQLNDADIDERDNHLFTDNSSKTDK